MMVSDSVTVDIMPFVEAVYVLDPVDGNYIQLESFDDKFMELSSLKESDDIVLSKNISKIIEKYNIKFGFRDVSCPHCKAKMEDVEIDSIENLLLRLISSNFRSIIQSHYDFEDAILRLFRGDITLEDIYKMPRKELMERMEARIRSMKQDDGREQQARELMAAMQREGV